MFLEAIKLKYQAEMEAARANIYVYMRSPSGIGEHPDIVDAIETQVKRYNEAKEMRDTTKELMDWYEDEKV